MDFKQWLSEMPISKAELVGKWDKWPEGKKQHQHWDKASYNILTNDPGLEKLKNKWKNVPQTFDMYFIKKAGMRDHIEVGDVDEEYLEQLGIKVPPIDPSHITIFFTNNRAAERIPMTPWTIGHRFGHAARRINAYQNFIEQVDRDFRELLKEIYGLERPSPYGNYGFGGYRDDSGNKWRQYEQFMRKLMEGLGTMRSARKGELFRTGEFQHELFGQYIIQGEITFRDEIPRQLVTRYAWGNPTWDGSAHSKVHRDEHMLEYMIEKVAAAAGHYNVLCNRILNECIGKIFVM